MNDLISRQAAIDAVRATLLAWSYMPKWRDNKIIEAVKRLPPIQPKRGRWIKLDMHRGMADHKCTACKQECYVPTCMGEPMYAFCPNCGADMRGEQNE